MNILYKKRALLMNQNGEAFPAGYTPIEYIESDLTQYIDTGYVPSQSDTEIQMEFAALSRSQPEGNGESKLFGATDDFATGIGAYFRDNTEFVFVYAQYSRKSFGRNLPVLDKKSKLILNRSGCLLDEEYIENSGNVMPKIDYNILIFCENRRGTPNFPFSSKMKLYNFKIIDYDKLVRDFRPALDADGKPCIVDLVEKKPYYSPVGNDFIAGGVL